MIRKSKETEYSLQKVIISYSVSVTCCSFYLSYGIAIEMASICELDLAIELKILVFNVPLYELLQGKKFRQG